MACLSSTLPVPHRYARRMPDGVRCATMAEMNPAEMPHPEDEREDGHTETDKKADEKQGFHVRLLLTKYRDASCISSYYTPPYFIRFLSFRSVPHGNLRNPIGVLSLASSVLYCDGSGKGCRQPTRQARGPASMSMPQEPAPNGPPSATGLTVGRVMLFTAAALFVIFIANLLLKVTDLLFLLLIGILLATAIDPLARRLRKMGLNRPASILSVYLLIFAIVGGLIAFIIPPIVAQGTDFATNLPRVADHLEQRYANSDAAWVRNAAHGGAVKLRQLSDNPPDMTGVLKEQAVNVVSSVFGALLSIVTVLLISFYWLT